jgi:hypothetical protein
MNKMTFGQFHFFSWELSNHPLRNFKFKKFSITILNFVKNVVRRVIHSPELVIDHGEISR